MNLLQALETTLPGLGYELVDCELAANGLVRVFIDKPEGIGIEDCVLVSNQLTRVFTVENIPYEQLEVSSPGLDRPLRKASDFARFAGQEAKIRTRLPIDGKKNFVGEIVAASNDGVELKVGLALVAIDLSNIDKARLVPKFN